MRHLHIKRFAPSAPQLQKFKDQLSATWKPLLGRPESSQPRLPNCSILPTSLWRLPRSASAGKDVTASNITGALPTPHYKLNYLPCSAFNGTSGSFPVRLASAAGNPRSIYPLALLRWLGNGNGWSPHSSFPMESLLRSGVLGSLPRNGARRTLQISTRSGSLRSPTSNSYALSFTRGNGKSMRFAPPPTWRPEKIT